MADCGSNRTLDPFQIILDNIDRTTTTLERQARDILPDVTDFRNEGEGFIEGDISPSETVDNAMTAFTKEAICASKTDLEPINQFIEDCLNDALRGVRQYLNEILGNVEDGIDLIEEILALPEKNLMQLLQNHVINQWSLNCRQEERQPSSSRSIPTSEMQTCLPLWQQSVLYHCLGQVYNLL